MQLINLLLKKLKGRNNLQPAYDLAKYDFVGRTVETETFLTEAKNVDISDMFHVRRRQGCSLKYTGAPHSLWSNGTICLFREGTYLKRFLPDYSAVTVMSGLTTKTIPMSYLEVIGKIYFSDGINNGVIDNGIQRTWGIVPPRIAYIGSSSGGGSLIPGDYKISLTYARGDGQESGALEPLNIRVGDVDFDYADIELIKNSIYVNTIASLDPSVKNINIYFSSSNKLFYYGTISNSSTSVTITADRIRGKTCKTIGLSPMPVGDILEYYNGRIYVINGAIAWYSEPFSYELCNLATNYIMFEEPITLFGAVEDGIWLCTERECYYARGNEPPFSFEKQGNYGAIKGTMQRVPGSFVGNGELSECLMWLSRDGICIGAEAGKVSKFENLTSSTNSFPSSISGASLFRQQRGINQVIFSLKDTKEEENKYE